MSTPYIMLIEYDGASPSELARQLRGVAAYVEEHGRFPWKWDIHARPIEQPDQYERATA